jgi:hypothetical protein
VSARLALSRADFDAAFARITSRGIPYGESFRAVGTDTGPGLEDGRHDPAPTLYCSDPSKHWIEIRTYEAA